MRFRATRHQERFWYVHQLNPTVPNNLVRTWELTGELERAALHSAYATLVQRHEVLRSAFVAEGNDLYLVPACGACGGVEEVDLRAKVQDDAYALALETVREDIRLAFDLKHGPPSRCTLILLPDSRSVLSINVHHIVADDASIAILSDELWECYWAVVDKVQPVEFSRRLVRFSDFAAAQNRAVEGPEFESERSYWTKLYADAATPVGFPLEAGSGPATIKHRQGVMCFSLEDQIEGLQRLTGDQRVTTAIALTAAVAFALSSYAASEDIVVGFTVANRSHSSADSLVGLVADFLPVRLRIDWTGSVSDALRKVRQAVLEAMAHGSVSPASFLWPDEAMRLKSGPKVFINYFDWRRRSAYGQVGRSLHIEELQWPEDTEWPTLEPDIPRDEDGASAIAGAEERQDGDVAVVIAHTASDIVVHLCFNPDRVDLKSAQAWGKRIARAVEVMVQAPEFSLKQLAMALENSP